MAQTALSLDLTDSKGAMLELDTSSGNFNRTLDRAAIEKADLDAVDSELHCARN